MKTLDVVTLALLALLLTAFLVSYRILSQGFADLEKSKVESNIQCAVSALAQESFVIDTLVFYWVAWDDTYAFIEGGNEAYIDSNLVDAVFFNTPLNIIVYIKYDGEIVFGKAFALNVEQETALPYDLLEHLGVNGTLLRRAAVESSIRGMLLRSPGPMILASRPITTSEMDQPVRGAVIM
jgi:sensor domain CHASE-containing protein